MERKSYKDVANQLFNEKITNEFPQWEIIKADIGTGYITLKQDDISVKLQYDQVYNKYHIRQIIKDDKSDTFTSLDEIVSLFKGVKK